MNRSWWVCTLLLVAACGAAHSSTVIATAASGDDAAFACALEHLKALRFEVLSLNQRDRRVVATRRDPTVRRAEPTFRHGFDQVTVQVRSRGGEASIEVTAQSFHEHFTRRGPTYYERRVSDGAREAARSVLEACAETNEDEDEHDEP